MNTISRACVALVFASAVSAGVIRPAAEVEFKASGSLPPGAEYHLMHEDAATKGVHALVRFSKGYALPPHAHTKDETIVVTKGKLEVTKDGVATVLGPGGYAVFAAGEAHGLAAKGWGGCEFVMMMNGPFDFSPAK